MFLPGADMYGLTDDSLQMKLEACMPSATKIELQALRTVDAEAVLGTTDTGGEKDGCNQDHKKLNSGFR